MGICPTLVDETRRRCRECKATWICVLAAFLGPIFALTTWQHAFWCQCRISKMVLALSKTLVIVAPCRRAVALQLIAAYCMVIQRRRQATCTYHNTGTLLWSCFDHVVVTVTSSHLPAARCTSFSACLPLSPATSLSAVSLRPGAVLPPLRPLVCILGELGHSATLPSLIHLLLQDPSFCVPRPPRARATATQPHSRTLLRIFFSKRLGEKAFGRTYTYTICRTRSTAKTEMGGIRTKEQSTGFYVG